MTAGGDAYRPGASPARVTALLFIGAAHIALIGAAALLGGTAAAIREAKPLFVRFVAPAPPPPSHPVPRIPLPAMRVPDIRLPSPTSIETIAVRLEERPAAPVAVPPQATLTPEMPKAAATVEPPRFDLAYLNNPSPIYPPISRRLREEGRVVLRVLVNSAGLVDSIEVVDTSGYARLDETALAAVRRWRFVPARSGENAVAGWAIVPIAFHLQG